jgi:hypothetical protein
MKPRVARRPQMFKVEFLWAGLILLMFGGTIRFCAVTPEPFVTEGVADDALVAKSLELVTRSVRPRSK